VTITATPTAGKEKHEETKDMKQIARDVGALKSLGSEGAPRFPCGTSCSSYLHFVLFPAVAEARRDSGPDKVAIRTELLVFDHDGTTQQVDSPSVIQ
jgi:hypothetical protein